MAGRVRRGHVWHHRTCDAPNRRDVGGADALLTCCHSLIATSIPSAIHPACSSPPHLPRSFPCPQYINPTDHFLSVLREDKSAATVVEAYAASMPALGSPGSSEGKGKAADAECDIEAGIAAKDATLKGGRPAVARTASDAAAMVEAERPHVSFPFQIGVLSLRMLRNWGRNPMMLAAEAVQVGS